MREPVTLATCSLAGNCIQKVVAAAQQTVASGRVTFRGRLCRESDAVEQGTYLSVGFLRVMVVGMRPCCDWNVALMRKHTHTPVPGHELRVGHD